MDKDRDAKDEHLDGVQLNVVSDKEVDGFPECSEVACVVQGQPRRVTLDSSR
jgi:hypothetical protein